MVISVSSVSICFRMGFDLLEIGFGTGGNIIKGLVSTDGWFLRNGHVIFSLGVFSYPVQRIHWFNDWFSGQVRVLKL